jgi:hypothetical protein
MASASEWVRQTVEKAQHAPLERDVILKNLEKHAGQGDRLLARVDDVLNYIDGELIERRGGQVMRDLWTTVADYREKVLEARSAA